MNEAYSLMLEDLTSIVKNKSGFETGDPSIELKDSGEFKNGIMLAQFDEDKNKVTYKATIAGTITNSANAKSVLEISF